MPTNFSRRSAIALFTFAIAVCWGFAVFNHTQGQTQQPDVGLGKAIYIAKCAACHGEDGRGEGVQAALLYPKPRNFVDGVYKFRSTESGSIPTDADFEKVISEGLNGTSMIGWKKWISGDSLKAVIAYIKSFSPKFSSEQPKDVRISAGLMAVNANLAKGKLAYGKLQCAACHGDDGKGTGATETEFQDTWGNPIRVTNLTEPWSFRGGASAQEVFLRLRTGIDGTPMPSYVGSASDEEMWHLANYVLSLRRKPTWEMSADELKRHYAQLDAENKKNQIRRGEYLVKTMGCGDCHTPIEANGKHVRELLFAGGAKWSLEPFLAEVVTPNLTSDKETGLGNWTDEKIKLALTKGIRRDGSRMLPFPMPWTAYASLKEDDLNAMIAYLRTIPPVYNKIPTPEKPGFFSYMIGKFKMLILKHDQPGYIYPGNAGELKQVPVTAHTETRP
jgi:cytochrome c oxidase cbb3-type subunit 2